MKFIKEFKKTFTNPNGINEISILDNKKEFFSNLALSYLSIIIFTILFGSVILFFINPEKRIDFDGYSFLMIALLIPVFEELIFRLLIRLNYLNFVCLIISIVVVTIKKMGYITEVWFAIFALLLLTFVLRSSFKSDTSRNNTYLSLVYISSISFGLVHLLNYDSINCVTLSVIFYLIPKIFSGFIFSFLRLKYGLIGSISLHIIINSITYLFLNR